MFTGIVEEVGTVTGLEGQRLTIAASRVLEGVKLGDSIAVNGACLTVVDFQASSFSVDLAPETLKRTSFSVWAPGREATGWVVTSSRAMWTRRVESPL